MSRQNVVALLAVLLCVAGLAASETVARAPAEQAPRKPADILKAELHVIAQARQVLKTTEATPPAPGELCAGQSHRDQVILWSQRAVDVQRELGTKADFLAVLQSHKTLLQELLDLAKTFHNAGRATSMDVYEVEYRLLETESQLLKAEKSP